MNICIVGTGYVGLVSGTCFADLGHKVTCVDIDKKKIEGLKKGRMPIYEPGLEELVRQNQAKGRLKFSTSLSQGVKASEIIFIAVGTPPKNDGEADLTYVEDVARRIAQSMPAYRLIVEKSTVPVKTGEWIGHTIKACNKKKIAFDVASNPEFLREGSAINDFLNPDRIVIGVESKRAKKLLTELYKPLNAPILVTDIKSAEIIKHACNSFLATKLSFVNAISHVCDKAGADITMVARGMGLDKRIGKDFLKPGPGFGGFCLPKDLDAFITISRKLGYDFELLKAVRKVNDEQKIIVLQKIEKVVWNLKDKTIGILGLSFKANTDDMRFASSIGIIKRLQQEGARIKAYDPQAMENASRLIEKVQFSKDPYSLAKGCDCLVVLTDWDEFKVLEFGRIKKAMKQPVIVDSRNIYDPAKLKKLGFVYISMGRS